MKPLKINYTNATLNQINTWAQLAYNYVASPNLSKLLNPNDPMQRKFILNNLKQPYTEMAHLFSKLCK